MMGSCHNTAVSRITLGMPLLLQGAVTSASTAFQLQNYPVFWSCTLFLEFLMTPDPTGRTPDEISLSDALQPCPGTRVLLCQVGQTKILPDTDLVDLPDIVWIVVFMQPLQSEQ